MSFLRKIALTLGAASLAVGLVGGVAAPESRDTSWPGAVGISK
ncbi:hypothetical protein [Nocardioides pantholopis]|nr:hypothetical protein [Nocardioides pantholopis]